MVVTMIMCHEQKQVEEKHVCSGHVSSLREVAMQKLKQGTRRQELMQRLWRGAAYWMAPHALHSLISYTAHDLSIIHIS